MKPAAALTVAGVLTFGAWRLLKSSEAVTVDAVPDTTGIGDELIIAGQSAATFLDTVTGGILKISDMAKVTTSHLSNANMQAFLRVIRAGEGTSDTAGYRRIFGGQMFDSFADHPRVKVTKGGYTSTAAGAYQALAATWDETKRVMSLADFSPKNQDLFAVGRIAARGALDDVIAGRFEAAIRKVASEWASMPFSPYGQPTITLSRAAGIYTQNGGFVAAA